MRLTLNFETVLQRGDSMGFKWGLNGDQGLKDYFKRIGISGIGQDLQRDFTEAVQGHRHAADEDEEDQREYSAHVTSQQDAYWPIQRPIKIKRSLIGE